MARDILCIQTAGVGIERVFNISREVCHFRRGQQSASTVRERLICFHYDKMDSYDHKEAELADILIEIPRTLMELEEELQRRIDAINTAMETEYISDDDNEDLDTSSPSRLEFLRRHRPTIEQDIGIGTPKATLSEQRVPIDPRIWEYGEEDEEDEENEEEGEDEGEEEGEDETYKGQQGRGGFSRAATTSTAQFSATAEISRPL